jgi:hypothetical protein
MFHLFQTKRFDLDVAYISHICCNNIFQIFQPVLCCNKCFHVASYKCFIWMLHMFHTYVASVCSICSSVLYVRCIQVFHVVRGFRRAQGVERAPVPGDRERRAGDRWMGHAACRCPTDRARCGGRRSGHNGGARVGGNDLESKGTRRAVRARRVIQTCGRCDGTRCTCGTGKKISGWGRLRASLGASTAVTETGDSACIYLLSKMVSLASIC